MSVDRLDKINQEIVKLFGSVLQEESTIPPDVMITVTYAEAARDLRDVRIGISIYPLEKAEDTLEDLRGQMYDLQGEFNRQTALHPRPRIHLELDKGSAHAERIERTLSKLDR